MAYGAPSPSSALIRSRESPLASASAFGQTGDLSFSGVRVIGMSRNADAFRQAEVRRTGSDVARASAEASGLGNIESAIEQSGAYNAIVDFESSLQQLTQDPVDTALRAALVLSAAVAGTGVAAQASAQDHFAALRATFRGVDKVGERYVFNIGGNKYRLIAAIAFTPQLLWVKAVLTHADYDEGDWK